MVVLIGAGLLVRTLRNLHNINPGFDTRNVLLFGINPTLEKYDDPQIQRLYRTLQEQLAAVPGVVSVSYSADALLTGSLWTGDVHVEGRPQKTTEEVDKFAAGPDFLKTLRIPLLAGRTFSAADFELAAKVAAVGRAQQQGASLSPRRSSPTPAGALAAAEAAPPIPVLVNRAFVRKFFPGENPLGKRLDEGDRSQTSGDSAVGKPNSKSWEIVGVVGDTKNSTLRREIEPMVYAPLAGGGAFFEIRTASNASAFASSVRDVAKRVDSSLPLFSLHTQSEAIEGLLTQERVIARLASFFGVLALLLSCIGLYGLLSYEVARRTREIGIRMALGAERRDVLERVVGQGIKVTIIGLGAGILAGVMVARFLSSMLYGLKPADPWTLVAVLLVLTGCALLACLIPARRASKVDPIVALRYE
jgi:hypothetical protein